MIKKIRRYSILVLFCTSLTLLLFEAPLTGLLSRLNIQAIDSIALAQAVRSFGVYTVSSTGTNPHVATDDNGYVYVTYEDTSIYYRNSTNNGQTFSDAISVSGGTGWYPRIDINNIEDAYVIYTYQNTNYYASGNKSTHAGGTYSFTERLETATVGTPPEYTKFVGQHAIAVENVGGVDNVYVLLEDDEADVSDERDIHCLFSTNEGSSWTVSGGATGEINDNKPARYPSIAVKKSGENDVYAAWVYIDNSIEFDHSIGGGSNWTGDTTISGTATVEPQRPGLAAIRDPGGVTWVVAVWCASVGGVKNVYFRSANSGNYASWFTEEQLSNVTQYGGYNQDQPSIAARIHTETGDTGTGYPHLYAVWRDTRDNYIYFQEATWTGSGVMFNWGIDVDGDGDVSGSDEEGIDLRVSDSASGSEETPTVVASSNGEVYVVWRDTGASIKIARYGAAPTVSGAPDAPTGLSATAGDAFITLDWSDNTEGDFSYYNIYRGTVRGTYSLLGTSSISQYDNTGVTNGTTYWYVVTAVDTQGRESAYSGDARATANATDTSEPSAPTGLEANAGNGEVSLSWTASTSNDVSSYHIYRSLVSGSFYVYTAEIPAPITDYLNTASLTNPGAALTNGTTYYYVVTAIDTSNNESLDSNEASATPTSAIGTGTGTSPDAAPGVDVVEVAEAIGGPGGGCFIATACYGSPLAGEVKTLSKFRDRCLITNSPGRSFVRGYYRASPPLAGFIRARSLTRLLVRMQLNPWVKIARVIVGDKDSPNAVYQRGRKRDLEKR